MQEFHSTGDLCYLMDQDSRRVWIARILRGEIDSGSLQPSSLYCTPASMQAIKEGKLDPSVPRQTPSDTRPEPPTRPIEKPANDAPAAHHEPSLVPGASRLAKERQQLIEALAFTVRDYRADDLPSPDVERIERWIRQFDPEVQVPMLRELNHVVKRTYYSRDRVIDSLRRLVRAHECAFWLSARYLDIQLGGDSQREMLTMFDEVLRETCGFGLEECGRGSDRFIYLDDAVFTGGRVRQDLEAWINSDAPRRATVHIVVVARHAGCWYASEKLQETAKSLGKDLDLCWEFDVEFEDRKAYTDWSDVLRPTAIPDIPEAHEYVQAMSHKPILRTPGRLGRLRIFSGEEGRSLLEQEFLKAGLKIRRMCLNLSEVQRPLGQTNLVSLGFGSLIVTYRNCPNTTPLALWVGAPWNPLFPRVTNTETEARRVTNSKGSAAS